MEIVRKVLGVFFLFVFLAMDLNGSQGILGCFELLPTSGCDAWEDYVLPPCMSQLHQQRQPALCLHPAWPGPASCAFALPSGRCRELWAPTGRPDSPWPCTRAEYVEGPGSRSLWTELLIRFTELRGRRSGSFLSPVISRLAFP